MSIIPKNVSSHIPRVKESRTRMVKKIEKITPLIILLIFISPLKGLSQMTFNFKDLFDSLYRQHRINGDVLIAQKQKVHYSSTLGLAEKESQTANTVSSSFELASISKLFTVISIMQLKEQTKLSLDDNVKKYLPEFIYSEITIRHLLTHTSGMKDLEIFLPQAKKTPDKVFSNNDILTTLAELNPPLKSQPGEKWKYNNISYNLLALIIEKVSGLSYRNYVSEKILAPANMKSTCLKLENQTCSRLKVPKAYRFANYFNADVSNVDTLINSDFQIKVFKKNFSCFYGSDNYFSTATDLLLLDKALYSNSILSAQSISEMFAPSQLSNGQKITLRKSGQENTMFGLGWFITEIDSVGKVVWHDGTNPGCETVFLRNISKQQSIIILDNFESEGIQKLAFAVLNQLNNKATHLPAVSLTRIFGQTVSLKGVEEGLKIFTAFKPQTEKYFYDENSLNDLGYQFIKAKKLNEAIAVFKLTTEEFPTSANAFDSYGEALNLADEKEKAIAAYQKVLELDPSNENAKKIIEKLKNK